MCIVQAILFIMPCGQLCVITVIMDEKIIVANNLLKTAMTAITFHMKHCYCSGNVCNNHRIEGGGRMVGGRSMKYMSTNLI